MQPEETKPQAPFPVEPVPPEILEWARQNTTEELFWESMREMERTGGGLNAEEVLKFLEADAEAS